MPILGGEFVIDRRFGYRDGLMGGNLWFFGKDVDSRAGRGRARHGGRSRGHPGVIMPFPGGIAASGSKAGSRYSFADRQHLRAVLPDAARKRRASNPRCPTASTR